MTNFAEIKQGLRRQDPDELEGLVFQFIDEGGGFDEVLRQMLYLAATEDFHSDQLPGILFLDAVRDLMTLYESGDSGSGPLIVTAIQGFSRLSLKEFDDEVVKLGPEDMSATTFVMDFQEYVLAGERENALHEASKLILLMDNPFYLVEILIEIASRIPRDNGMALILGSVVLKQLDFVGSARYRHLIWQLTDYITRLEMGMQHSVEESSTEPDYPFQEQYRSLLHADDTDVWPLVLLTHAQIIWDEVRMKEARIRQNLSTVLPELLPEPRYSKVSEEFPNRDVALDQIQESLTRERWEEVKESIPAYLHGGGDPGELFRVMTDAFISSIQGEGLSQVIHWNGYRTAIASLRAPERYQAFLRAAEYLLEGP